MDSTQRRNLCGELFNPCLECSCGLGIHSDSIMIMVKCYEGIWLPEKPEGSQRETEWPQGALGFNSTLHIYIVFPL